MTLTVVRYGISMNPVPQLNNPAAPCKEGYWAFFAGFECPAITGRALDEIAPKYKIKYEDVCNLAADDPQWLAFVDERSAWEGRKAEIAKKHFKRYTFTISNRAYIYCGWKSDGTVTRSGFFNSGPWQHMAAYNALKGLRRQVARLKAVAATKHKGTPWKYLCDEADWQIFIPTSSLRGE